MDKWEKFKRRRDDDPYHAWMLHRRLSEEALLGRFADPGPICPMVIKAVPEGGEPTTKDLENSLKAIQGLIEERLLFVSYYDRMHIERSLSALDRMDGPLDQSHDYLRYYLVYAEENLLFPRSPAESGSDVSLLSSWSKIFSIPFIGAGISDIVRGESTQMPPAGIPRYYDSSLTVIDDSFAFLNEEFVTRSPLRGGDEAYTWRFDEIWFQEFKPKPGSYMFSGHLLNNDSVSTYIGNAESLSEFDRYRKSMRASNNKCFTPLDLSSASHQPLAFSESHGTHVTSRALRVFGENNRDDLDLGLSAVALPVEVTENASGSTLGSYLLAGIRQAMMWNDDLYPDPSKGESPGDKKTPLVINFSYGFLAGMKDGTSKLNRVIAAFIDARNHFFDQRPTALVVPMGNSYDARGVARDTLDRKDDTLELDWVVQPDDRTSSFLEIYAASKGKTELSFELTAPDGSIKPLKAKTAKIKKKTKYKTKVLKRDRKPGKGGEKYRHAAEWSEWAPEPGSDWDRRVFIAIGPTQSFDPVVGVVPSGRWKLAIRNTSGEKIEVLAMVQRDDVPGTYPERGRQSYLDHRHAWEAGASHHVFANSGDYQQLGGPVIHAHSGSIFAAIDSNHVFTVGAGRGPYGDGMEPTTGRDALPMAEVESYYASEGPRRLGMLAGCDGPDYSGLADRSDDYAGVHAAGTYSHTDTALGGSSVAVPEFAGLCAANPEIIVQGRAYFTNQNAKNPKGVKKPDSRFGLIKEAIT